MADQKKKREYIFDAEGKKLGRLVSEIAAVLRGKNEPDFVPHKAPNVLVIINNASKVDLGDAALKKEYKRYSGYPGGLTKETRKHLIARKGYRDVFEKAIYGMLPNNKLRPIMMKNIIINE